MDNEQYLNEVKEALDKDNSRLGEVWKLEKEGKSAIEIAEKLNVSTPGFVYTQRRHIKAILEGNLPDTPTTATQCGRALRGFLRHKDAFSEETIQTLEERAKECDRWATDPQALEEENEEVEKETVQALKSDVAGIYVYTYPHYDRYPVIPGEDDIESRTYLKIGMTSADASTRVNQQSTGMPESPKILQIWLVENESEIKEVEEKIHKHLRTIGHGGENKRKEWFLTNEQSVASTANLLGLTLHDHKNQKTDD